MPCWNIRFFVLYRALICHESKLRTSVRTRSQFSSIVDLFHGVTRNRLKFVAILTGHVGFAMHDSNVKGRRKFAPLRISRDSFPLVFFPFFFKSSIPAHSTSVGEERSKLLRVSKSNHTGRRWISMKQTYFLKRITPSNLRPLFPRVNISAR